MTAGGSLNLRKFRTAIRDGVPFERACEIANISEAEAELILADDAAVPPPPEAFILHGGEDDMARGAAKSKPISGEVPKPDFDLALKLYREDIRPAQNRVGEFAQEQSTAYKAIKKNAHIQPGAAKAAFKLMETEDAKRDDFIRSFVGLLQAAGKWPKEDLVDKAEGKSAPGARPKPKLVTVPAGPADDADLAGDANEPSAVAKAVGAAESKEDDDFYGSAKDAAE